ncbi:Hypothetical predicted protein [Cloeon dipterum]|uniref:Serpin domain-containing protein n=1 Tax=Cloeon dipterum TaxID=197152 RepID=A0A8S1CPX4_9INSE|nr:Hypothetical predicted protein [Cloeon dipterum]
MDANLVSQSPMGAFGVNFYKAIGEQSGNLIASPLSAYFALAMVLMGARGKSESEMLRVLRLPAGLSAKNDIERLFSELTSHLNSMQQVELSLANRAFAAADIRIKPDYAKSLTKTFSSQIANVNFADPKTKNLINEWVEKVTKNKIRNLFKDDFDSATRLVLVNAVYFKGSWKNAFDKKLTSSQKFKTGGSSVQVQMMSHPRKTYMYRNLEEYNAQLLELPYKGGELSMVIILPNKDDGLAQLERSLGRADIAELLSKASNTSNVIFSMPKFKIETSLKLNAYLQKMGLVDIFTKGANLTGISEESLSVTTVVQKAFIEVNEEGTEAAASTGIGIGLTSVPNFTDFRCDHPFLYFVTFKRLFTLFGGRVMNPAA